MRLRRIAQKIQDQAERLELYRIFSAAHLACEYFDYDLNDEFVAIRQCGREIYFPRPLPIIKHAHISCGYENWLAHKYALPGFVEVEPEDIVVDCGAYVGGFSLSAQRAARQVHVFEPSSLNYAACVANFRNNDAVVVNHAGLFNRGGEIELNLSTSGVEHSMLAPDDGDVIGVEKVKIFRLDEYCRAHGVDKIDFLKIEAEGVELEVHEGLGDIKATKIAIDVSPERDGESPAETFKERLTAAGYELRQRGHVLFARLP